MSAQIHNGHVTHVSQGNTMIHHPAGGTRTVVAVRGNRTVVVRGGGHGYVQQRVFVGRRAYVARTFYGGEVRAYRQVFYRGAALHFYAPFGYYPLGFYGWALGPWDSPIDYPWGWAGTPWYGYYGSYYRPWAVYPRASFWLTDYLIARTLQNAYEMRAEARAREDAADNVESAAPLSDEIKEMVEAEVRKQLAEAQAEARAEERGSAGSADALPPAFNDRGMRLFLASDSLEVENASTGETCVIGDGDAIQMNGGVPQRGETVNVRVLASKGSNCAANSTVAVQLNDLVEMHNHMREALESGMEDLRTHQGTDNLPTLPENAAGELRLTAFAASFQPDTEAVSMLEDTAGQADQLEQQVLADYGTAADPEPFPTLPSQRMQAPSVPATDTRENGLLASLQMGQTESQVVAIMGQPLNTSFLGGVKKLYEYRSGKVTFTDGEVSEVETGRPGGLVAQQQSAPPPPAQPQPPVNRTVVQPPAPRPAAPASRGTINVGMTEGEVAAILGQPIRVSFLGGLQKMYEYRDRKVIFTDGNVSDVQ